MTSQWCQFPDIHIFIKREEGDGQIRVIATWALFSTRGIPLRSLILLNSCCWLVHNLLTGSVGGSLIEATFVVTNSITIYKLYKAAVVSVPVIQEVKL
ncbi:YgjV family protein [Endozoicomonas sp. ALE010]|uniref:YgjV family protein n=1 Tax=Endozoicomonas sp. ALE010 TaxID=3403081 RepID=UPI003BB6C338